MQNDLPCLFIVILPLFCKFKTNMLNRWLQIETEEPYTCFYFCCRMESVFNFIQQKSPTSISGEVNANRYEIQRGFKLRLNKVKASGGDIRF